LKNFHYKQFDYVKIFGSVRIFKEERAIVGTHISKIEKFDEITNHFLQIFVSHQIRVKGTLTSKDIANVENKAGPETNNNDLKNMAIHLMKQC